LKNEQIDLSNGSLLVNEPADKNLFIDKYEQNGKEKSAIKKRTLKKRSGYR
jgi:hypothetical protein